jgi:hypothetical protein
VLLLAIGRPPDCMYCWRRITALMFVKIAIQTLRSALRLSQESLPSSLRPTV